MGQIPGDGWKGDVTVRRGRDGMHHPIECECAEARERWEAIRDSAVPASDRYWEAYDAFMKVLNNCPEHGKRKG